MTDIINLTITEQDEEEIQVTSTEEGPIYIQIMEIATVDPEVAAARDEAVAAAETATEKAQEAVDAVAGLETVINEAVQDAIEAERPNSIINALIFG